MRDRHKSNIKDKLIYRREYSVLFYLVLIKGLCVCGSCGTPLSTSNNSVLCGVDDGVPQLLQTLSESFDYVLCLQLVQFYKRTEETNPTF